MLKITVIERQGDRTGRKGSTAIETLDNRIQGHGMVGIRQVLEMASEIREADLQVAGVERLIANAVIQQNDGTTHADSSLGYHALMAGERNARWSRRLVTT